MKKWGKKRFLKGLGIFAALSASASIIAIPSYKITDKTDKVDDLKAHSDTVNISTPAVEEQKQDNSPTPPVPNANNKDARDFYAYLGESWTKSLTSFDVYDPPNTLDCSWSTSSNVKTNNSWESAPSGLSGYASYQLRLANDANAVPNAGDAAYSTWNGGYVSSLGSYRFHYHVGRSGSHKDSKLWWGSSDRDYSWARFYVVYRSIAGVSFGSSSYTVIKGETASVSYRLRSSGSGPCDDSTTASFSGGSSLISYSSTTRGSRSMSNYSIYNTIRGLDVGTTTLYVSVGGYSASTTIKVIYATIKTISISQTVLNMRKGEEFDIYSVITNVTNIDPAYNYVEWTSSEPSLVNVLQGSSTKTKSGESLTMFCYDVGQAVIRCTTHNGIYKECVVNVTYADVKSVAISSEDTDIQLNGTTSVNAWLEDERYVDPNSIITWQSNDASIKISPSQTKGHESVTLTSTGIPNNNPVKIIAQYRIPGKDEYIYAPACMVSVRGVKVDSLSTRPTSRQASLGETISNEVYAVLDAKADPKSLITWISREPDCVEVIDGVNLSADKSPTLVVKAPHENLAEPVYIDAIYTNPDTKETVTASLKIYITNPFPTGIKIVDYPGKDQTGYVIQGVAGQAGNAITPCAAEVYPNEGDRKASQDVEWELTDFDKPAAASFIYIDKNNGLIGWKKENTVGDYKFMVKATALAKDSTGIRLTDQTEVHLNLKSKAATVSEVKVNGGVIDKVNHEIKAWVNEANQSTPFTATVSPKGANQAVTWSLVKSDKSEWTDKPDWLTISTDGKISWTSNVEYGEYKFVVCATSLGTSASGDFVNGYTDFDVTLNVQYREPTAIQIYQFPGAYTAEIGIDAQKEMPKAFQAQITPANARQDVDWSFEEIILKGETDQVIETPSWLHITAAGLVWWGDETGTGQLPTPGIYSIKVRAACRDKHSVYEISQPVLLELKYRQAIGISFTGDTLNYLKNIQAYINDSSNSKIMTGKEFEAVVLPVGEANPDCVWKITPKSGYETPFNKCNLHFGDPKTNPDELENVLYWNDQIDSPAQIETTVTVISIDGAQTNSMTVTIGFDYADINEINVDKEKIEVSGMPAEGQTNGSITATTNNMPSLQENEKLFWSVSDVSALELLADGATFDKEKNELVTKIDTVTGATIEFKLLKDSFFGFKYKIYCKNSDNTIIKEIIVSKPFPWWLIIVMVIVAIFLIALLIWLPIHKHRKAKKNDKKAAKNNANANKK